MKEDNVKNYIENKLNDYKTKDFSTAGFVFGFNQKEYEEPYTRFKKIYSNFENENLQEIFSGFHYKFNNLLNYMNGRINSNNRHYTANESRELINIISEIKNIQFNLKDTAYAYEIEKYYLDVIRKCDGFLSNSGGSAIPENFSKISVNEMNPIFIRRIVKNIEIDTPVLKDIDYQYITTLPNRCECDMNNKNFDSVITKSRTLLEETLIYVLEKRGEPIVAKGDINKLYNQFKKMYNMQQTKDNDKRINELLGGIEKIINSIAEMRNNNSDAHGVGSKRINIIEHHARLYLNSAMMISEFILSVYKNKEN